MDFCTITSVTMCALGGLVAIFAIGYLVGWFVHADWIRKQRDKKP